jgi:hypothetical protein
MGDLGATASDEPALILAGPTHRFRVMCMPR